MKKKTQSNFRSDLPTSFPAGFQAALFGLSLDRDGGASLQAQLTDALRALILADPGLSGSRLPASRTLAAELSVSRTTVQTAFDQLIGEGYLAARQGSGTFIADNLPHLAPPRPRPYGPRPAPQSWLPFQTGIPDQSLLQTPAWTRLIERAWTRAAPDLLARPDPFGWYPLRQAIADHLSAWRGLDCHPDQVLITSGAQEAFEAILRPLLAPQATAAIEDPGWPTLRRMLSLAGGRAHPLKVDGDGLDPAAIPAGTALAVVTPSRHFPTGATMPLARRLALLHWASETGGLVIEDDYDSEFRYKGQPLPSLAGLDGHGNVIYLGSFSKLLSPALRIGYAVLPDRHLPAVRAHIAQTGSRASLFPQPALAQLMASGDFAIHLRRMRRLYARRQAHLLSRLAPLADLLDIRPDPAGMHLCLPLRPHLARRLSDRDIAALAEADGLRLSALSPLSTLPDPPQALLLGYAAFDEPALTTAADRLTALLGRFR